MLANASALIGIVNDRSYENKTQGYLQVLQGERWRKLYTVLKANLLFFFESHERLEIPKMLLIVEDCIVDLADDNAIGVQHSFTIRYKTTGNTYTFAAPSAEELAGWVSFITTSSFDFMLATRDTLVGPPEKAQEADETTMEKIADDGKETTKIDSKIPHQKETIEKPKVSGPETSPEKKLSEKQ